jgi:hypothetical protein
MLSAAVCKPMQCQKLLNAVEVSNYLAPVAPVPFHPDFTRGEEISKYLNINGVALHPLSIDVLGEGLVYWPKRNAIISGGKPLHLAGLGTFATIDRDGVSARYDRAPIPET